MSKIHVRLFGAAIAAGMLCSFGLAADIVKPQPRKKFKLHVVGLGFKTSDMPAARAIPQPSYQAPGVIVGDAAIYTAEFSPSLTLPDARYSWIGTDSSFGATGVVSYSQAGDRAVVLNVLDRNSNTNKFVGVAAQRLAAEAGRWRDL